MTAKLLTPAYVAAALAIKPQSLRLYRMRGQGQPSSRRSRKCPSRA